MRFWLFLPLLAGLALAQDPQAAPPKTETWTVAAPASNPTGDPIQFKMSLATNKVHHLATETHQSMNTPNGQTESDFGMDARLHFTSSLPTGGAAFEMPLEFTKMSMGGRDMLPMIKGMLTAPKVSGQVDSHGVVVPGSIQCSGMGPLGARLQGQMTSAIPYWPHAAVRVGETWEMPLDPFTSSLKVASGGGKVTGSAYQTLEKIEEHDGVKCGVVRVVFAVNFANDKAQLQPGVTGKETLHMKGDGHMYYGLDGYLHGLELHSKMSLDVTLQMGNPMHMEGETTVKTTGGPEDFAPAAAPTTPSKAGGEKGESGESGEAPEKPEKPGEDDDGGMGGDR